MQALHRGIEPRTDGIAVPMHATFDVLDAATPDAVDACASRREDPAIEQGIPVAIAECLVRLDAAARK